MIKQRIKDRNLGVNKSAGFTLIEILIVIVLLGILAVAVLSAINPLEQIRKARDSGRKSDAAELLNGYERYYTTFGCHTWDTACTGTTPLGGTVNPGFASGENSEALVTNNEVKSQFARRSTVTEGELWVTEDAAGLVNICFEPESTSARNGGLGDTYDIVNVATSACTGDYLGGIATATCFVCVPQ